MNILQKIAVALIVTAFVLFTTKNYYLEYKIIKELFFVNVHGQKVECNGGYNITCKIEQLKYSLISEGTTYNITIEEILLNNILNIYGTSRIKDYYGNFDIHIRNLKLEDSEGVIKKISQPFLFSISADTGKINVDIRNEKMTFDVAIQSHNLHTFNIITNIKQEFIKNMSYAAYNLKYLEIRRNEGDDIVRGVNISLGVASNSLISKKDFLDISYPRFLDLVTSEIESHETFTKYNKNQQFSLFLEDVLMKSGTINHVLTLE